MSSLRNRLRFSVKQLKRLPVNLMIRNLVNWEPQATPEAGYSVAVACMRELAPIAIANMKMCARLNLKRMHEMILVFDCPIDQVPAAIVDAVQELSSSFAIRLVGYERGQHCVARLIAWGWVYSWISWCLAIRYARTRAVIIHDLDALPLAPDFFERLFDHWADETPEFCGIRTYVGNGVTEEMGLVTTYELVLDAWYLRQRIRPFDLFNKLRLVNGRIVDFDTMLFEQWRSTRPAVRCVSELDLVHPSQLICQHTDLRSGRSDLRGRDHMLPVLVYFLYLGGDATTLAAVGEDLAVTGARSFSLFGRKVYIDSVTRETWAWMEKQTRRVERACFGATRPEVEGFLRGFIARAGVSRTVGKETSPTAIDQE
jgi:hypothetical protein